MRPESDSEKHGDKRGRGREDGAKKNNARRYPEEGFVFEQFRVPRGCLGYLIGDPKTGLAALVDPEEEMVEPMMDTIFRHGFRPAYILDTHTHADHISGTKELKTKTVAKLVMHEKAPASGVDLRIVDGDRLGLGELSMKFLYTPGHAKDLVSVLFADRILTADALIIGSCGRTDLLNGNATQQYHTLYHTFMSLRDDFLVYPGHDYKGRSYSTLGEEKKGNPKMMFSSEEEFVRFMDFENPKELGEVYQLADALRTNMA